MMLLLDDLKNSENSEDRSLSISRSQHPSRKILEPDNTKVELERINHRLRRSCERASRITLKKANKMHEDREK